MSALTEPGLIYGMKDEVYHADPIEGGSLSSTFCRLLTDHAPSKAILRATNRKPSKAMNLGSAAHSHALGAGPELIVWQYDGRTKDGKAERAELADKIATQAAVGVTEAERDQILGMVAALRAVPEVAQILERSQSEVSSFWREGDIWGRARYDLLDEAASFDYKTAQDASPRGFQRAMASYGYHQQAEWYQRGLKALGHAAGGRRLRFIVQETEAPYIVQIHEPDDEAMDVAESLNDRAVRIYAQAKATGVWPGPERIVHDPTPLPSFYFYDHEDSLGPFNPEVELKLA